MLKIYFLFLILISPTLSHAKYITVKNGEDCIQIFDDDEKELSVFTLKKNFSFSISDRSN